MSNNATKPLARPESTENKSLLLSAIALILFIASVWFYVLNRIEKQIRSDINSTPQTVLATTQETIDLWAGERKRDIVSWAQSPRLRALVIDQLDVYHNRKDLNGPVQGNLDETLQSSIVELGYLGDIVIAPDFKEIASLLKYNLGESSTLANRSDRLLARVFNGETLITLPEPSDIPPAPGKQPHDSLNMFSATPIRNENHEIIAALLFRFDPTVNFVNIHKLGRTGESGETYAFNKEGLLLSESRFDNHLRATGIIPPGGSGILSIKISDPGGNMVAGYKPSLPRAQQPLTTMAKEATSGKSGLDLEGYRDYRGVPVVGAWTWDSSLGMGLTTEIDHDEAYRSFNATRFMILAVVIGIVSLFLFFMIAYTTSTRKRLSVLEALHSREIHMTALVDNMLDGVITIDTRGIIHSCNPASERIFGHKRDEMLGQNISMLMPSPHRGKHHEYIQNYLNTGVAGVIDQPRNVLACKKSGELFPINLSVATIPFEGALFFTGIIRDITDKMLAEKTLRESEQRLSLALEALHGGIWEWDLASNKMFFSEQWLKTFGYSPEDLTFKPSSLVSLAHPDDLPMIHALTKDHMEGKARDYQCAYRIRHKFGEWRWSYDQGQTVAWGADGKPLRVVGISTDITMFKRIEEELSQSRDQLRQLTNHVLSAQEEERRRVCREIHDELGQALTVIKINLSWIGKKLNPDQTDLLAKIKEVSKLTNNTIDIMRRIASGLRPQILEDLGLQTAIESHSREISKQTGLECTIECDMLNIKLETDQSFTLFRIYQEAMTNVIRHAQASKVVVTLRQNGNEITLTVTDNGQGIEENMILFPVRKSFGLLGIKERAAILGGSTTIQGTPGKGTSVTVSLPSSICKTKKNEESQQSTDEHR